jgi:hypothetical protein
MSDQTTLLFPFPGFRYLDVSLEDDGGRRLFVESVPGRGPLPGLRRGVRADPGPANEPDQGSSARHRAAAGVVPCRSHCRPATASASCRATAGTETTTAASAGADRGRRPGHDFAVAAASKVSACRESFGSVRALVGELDWAVRAARLAPR